jgi:hypothetical protein
MQDLAGGILVWEEERDPLYALDVFASDLEVGSEIQISPLDPGVEEGRARTDGLTVVYTTHAYSGFTGLSDAMGYDLGDQLRFPIAASSSSAEFATGVSGDFVVLSINTGGGASSVTTQRISNGTRVPFGGDVDVDAVDGDYVLYEDIDSVLSAYRLSTGTTTVIGTSVQDLDLAGGVVVWTELNGATSSYDVYTKTLPAGATTPIAATTANEHSVAMLSSGPVWSVSGEPGYALYSADGGTTVEIASGDRLFLKDRASEYDVAIISPSEYAPGFLAETLDAVSAAGVPILAFDFESSNGVGGHYADDGLYNLTFLEAYCGAAFVDFGIAHPAIDGFFGFVQLEKFVNDSHASSSFDVFAGAETPPADWVVLATHGSSAGSCSLSGQTVIATFTNADGTAVILDGVAVDDVGFWLPERRALVLSELRYLASTRAP